MFDEQRALVERLRSSERDCLMPYFRGLCGEAADEIERLSGSSATERERVAQVLEPFALAADDLDDKHGDHIDLWEAPAAMNITAGQIRAARKLFDHLTPSGGGDAAR